MATFRYPKAEFACMVCGRKLGFLGPVGKPDTPELRARHDELRALFDSGVEPGQAVAGRCSPMADEDAKAESATESLILENVRLGYMEFAGVDASGAVAYRLTDAGRKRAEELLGDR